MLLFPASAVTNPDTSEAVTVAKIPCLRFLFRLQQLIGLIGRAAVVGVVDIHLGRARAL